MSDFPPPPDQHLTDFDAYFHAFVAKFPALADLIPKDTRALRLTFYHGANSALIVILSKETANAMRGCVLALRYETADYLIDHAVGPAAAGTLAEKFNEFFEAKLKDPPVFSHKDNARETFYAGATAALLLVADTAGHLDHQALARLVPQLSTESALGQPRGNNHDS